MTSQQFSANKAASKFDFKTALKSVIAPTVLTFLFSVFIFIAQPLYTLLYSATTFVSKLNESSISIKASFCSVLTATSNGETVGIIFLALGALFALFAFRFLSRKKALNVFFSASIDRRTLFKNRVLASVLMMASSLALPIIIDIAVNITLLGHTSYILQYAVALYAECFVYAFTGFAIMAMAMTFCSTVVEGLFFGTAIALAPTVVISFFNCLCTLFLRGYNRQFVLLYPSSYLLGYLSSSYNYASLSQPSLLDSTSIVNPLFLGSAYGSNHSIYYDNLINFCYRMTTDTSTNEYYDAMYIESEYFGYEKISFNYILPLIVWAVIAICFVLIARHLMIKMKAENAGVHGARAFASRFFAIEIALIASALAITGCDYIFISSSSYGKDNYVIHAIVAVITAVVAYLIISAICKRSIKLKANELITPGAMLATIVITIVILSTGGFGYSDYVPEVDKIDKAVITNNLTDIAGTDLSYSGYSDSYTGNILDFSYYSDSVIGVFTDSDDLTKLTDINKRLTEKTDNMTDSGITVYYTLKNGKIVSRSYYMVDRDAAYSVLSMRDSKAADDELSYLLCGNMKDHPLTNLLKDDKNILNALFLGTAEEDMAYAFQKGNVYAINSDNINTYKAVKNTPELRQALLADLKNQTFEERFRPNEKAIGGLYFTTDLYDENGDYVDYEEYTYSSYMNGYYIYPSMTNTVNYLKSTGEYKLLEVKDKIKYVTVESEKSIAEMQAKSDYADYYYTSIDVFNLFVSSNINPGSYDETDYYDDYIPITDYFKNGRVYRNSKQISALVDSSVIYYSLDTELNGYVLLVVYEDGKNVTRYIPAEKMPDWAISKAK